MYLLDANVVITTNEKYYPVERVPEFWDWLGDKAADGEVKIPQEIWDEITPTDGPLKAWLKEHRDDLILNDDAYLGSVQDILDLYATDLSEAEVESIGGDPFLIAAARESGAVVVTKEGGSTSKQRGNRRVPDVCKEAGVRCIDDHELIRELDFRTSYKKS